MNDDLAKFADEFRAWAHTLEGPFADQIADAFMYSLFEMERIGNHYPEAVPEALEEMDEVLRIIRSKRPVQGTAGRLYRADRSYPYASSEELKPHTCHDLQLPSGFPRQVFGKIWTVIHRLSI